MSFESNQILATDDAITVMTETSARVIRLEILSDSGSVYATLNTVECVALIGVLQVAIDLADVYRAGDL